MKFSKTLTAAILAAGLAFSAQAADKMKIAMVVKTLGNGFFDAAHQGADEAAKQLGDVEVIFTGPAKATAEGQIELINSLVAQKVQAIVVSARACPEFCVNGVGLKVGHPFFELDSKASQRRFPIANGHGPFLADVS